MTVCRDQAVGRAGWSGSWPGAPTGGLSTGCRWVKDQLNTAGIRTTYGTPIFNDVVPAEDATVIAKLKAAGAILLGKLDMTEFGTTSLSHAFATARNPWDLERFTGGLSSAPEGPPPPACMQPPWGGYGRSVRGPAACAGVGLRPTWGRVSRHGLRPGMWSMDTIGPRARRRLRLTLQAIAGTIPTTPMTWMCPCPTIGPRWTGTGGHTGGRGQGAAGRRGGGARGARRRVPGGPRAGGIGSVVEEVSIP